MPERGGAAPEAVAAGDGAVAEVEAPGGYSAVEAGVPANDGHEVVNGVFVVVGEAAAAGSETTAAGTMASTPVAPGPAPGAGRTTTTAAAAGCSSDSATACGGVAAGCTPVAAGIEGTRSELTLAATAGRERRASAATAGVSCATAAAATAGWPRRRPVGELGISATRPSGWVGWGKSLG